MPLDSLRRDDGSDPSRQRHMRAWAPIDGDPRYVDRMLWQMQTQIEFAGATVESLRWWTQETDHGISYAGQRLICVYGEAPEAR